MIYALCGFLIGFVIPYMSRRSVKSMPSAPVYALYNLLKTTQTAAKAKQSSEYGRLKKRYFIYSLLFGVVTAGISWLVFLKFETNGIYWYLAFVWSLLLLAEVDARSFVLPDVVTIPLLLAGFAFAAFSSAGISPEESVCAALIGYVLPMLASLLMLWKSSEAFGFGDIKLLATIGAWLGAQNVIYVILVSCVVFAVESLIRRQRAGAFGPSLAVSAILILLFWY